MTETLILIEQLLSELSCDLFSAVVDTATLPQANILCWLLLPRFATSLPVTYVMTDDDWILNINLVCVCVFLLAFDIKHIISSYQNFLLLIKCNVSGNRWNMQQLS